MHPFDEPANLEAQALKFISRVARIHQWTNANHLTGFGR